MLRSPLILTAHRKLAAGDRVVVKGLLAVVWVAVGAVVGTAIGTAFGTVAGAAISALMEDGTASEDATAYIVGTMVAVGGMVIGAIAGAAGAVVWAIDKQGTPESPPERVHRYGDRPEDFR